MFCLYTDAIFQVNPFWGVSYVRKMAYLIFQVMCSAFILWILHNFWISQLKQQKQKWLFQFEKWQMPEWCFRLKLAWTVPVLRTRLISFYLSATINILRFKYLIQLKYDMLVRPKMCLYTQYKTLAGANIRQMGQP